VLVGENHRQAQDLEFVQAVIHLLPAVGVYTFGTEFARRIDQPLIDSLLRGASYDERLARLILFRNDVLWGYQEYADLFKAAWLTNREIHPGGRPIRVLGINNSPDFGQIRTPEEADDPARRAQVWHGETELDWARLVLDSVIARGEKALVHEGAHHAFSEFLQPVVNNGSLLGMESQRMGNFLFRRIGKRVITVYLQAPWFTRQGDGGPRIAPAEGAIDEVLARLPAARRRAGFDLTGTPFGALRDSSSVYAVGHGALTLDRMFDGWIALAAWSDIRPVRAIPGFINDDNLEEARRRSPNAALRHATVAKFNEAIASDAALAARVARQLARQLAVPPGPRD
jgi:hypothetical protein